jgi:hypothetical protein
VNRGTGMQRSLLALGISVFFLLPPAMAQSEEGTGDRGTDMVLDLLVLRPLGLVATGLGSVAFVVSLPFTLPSGSVGSTACELVKSPLSYTFTRPLGELGSQAEPCRGDQGKPSNH